MTTAASLSAGASGDASRLDRLESYLRNDPANESLLAEAFTAALRCGAWDRAEFHLRHARALWPQSPTWALRETEGALARGDLDAARQLLSELQTWPDAPRAFSDAVLHNLAFIDFQENRPADCVERLAPRMEAAASPSQAGDAQTPAALDVLWLRALHHAGDPGRAVQWAQVREQAGVLAPEAAGIAGLAALDAEQVADAARWAAQALGAEPEKPPLEALVTRSSLALAETDAPTARAFAEAALARQPGDGRARSALAFAQLLAGDIPGAIQEFRAALQSMPGHIGTWHGLGWAQIVAQDLAGARASFEHALELDRNFGESHGGLAVVFALLQDEPSARAHIERAARLGGGSLAGRFAEAVLWGEANPENFARLAERILGGQTSPGGSSMLDVVMAALRPRR